MPQQIIKDEKLVPVKYHGQVKYIVFECNYCHKEFVKPNSYYKKQLKTRTNACCFCSPDCKLKDQMENSAKKVNMVKKIEKADEVKTKEKKEEVKKPEGKEKGRISAFLKKFLLPN